MSFREPFQQRRRPVDAEEQQKSITMNPHLVELLSSADTDHLLEGGTGDFDFLITRLRQELADPKNTLFQSQIRRAIKRCEVYRRIDPVRVAVRNGLRGSFAEFGYDDILEPRGPMEL